MLPNYGVAPDAAQSVWELRLSHWTGPLPELTVNTNWAYHKYDHLFGTFLYKGAPVHGFRSTAGGNPLDTFGRNLYVDTFNSAYGPGWKRENSFLMHKGTGTFCYGFYPHGNHPIGKGERYRATIIGPGVTPDVSVVVAGRNAAVAARALAGDFVTAQSLVGRSSSAWDVRTMGPRRFVVAELEALLTAHGFLPVATTGVRVFADLVPSAIVDTEPGARDALYALERLLSTSADFTSLSAGLHTIARLDSSVATPDPGGKSAAL
jgi:hypothetical protein